MEQHVPTAGDTHAASCRHRIGITLGGITSHVAAAGLASFGILVCVVGSSYEVLVLMIKVNP